MYLPSQIFQLINSALCRPGDGWHKAIGKSTFRFHVHFRVSLIYFYDNYLFASKVTVAFVHYYHYYYHHYYYYYFYYCEVEVERAAGATKIVYSPPHTCLSPFTSTSQLVERLNIIVILTIT